MSNYLETAVSIAREAGALLIEMYKTPLEIAYKRPSDLITEADKRSEALIVGRLHEAYDVLEVADVAVLASAEEALGHPLPRQGAVAGLRPVLRCLGLDEGSDPVEQTLLDIVRKAGGGHVEPEGDRGRGAVGMLAAWPAAGVEPLLEILGGDHQTGDHQVVHAGITPRSTRSPGA